jgi:hypothetical protein
LALELPKLQPLAGKVKLKDIPYRLVEQQDNQLDIHLNIPEESEHPAIRFLAKMLIKNSSKLVKVSSSRQHRQLIDGLKVLAFQSFFSMPLFAHKEGKHVTLDLIGRSNGPDQVLSKLTVNGKPEETSIKWLARQLELNEYLKEIVDGVKSDDEVDIECLIRLPVQGLPAEVRRTDQFESEQSIIDFAETAIEQMRFAAMRLRLFKSESPDIDYLKHDMNAVTSHAIHRGRDIEKLLWQVVMCGQLIDITEEFLMRYKLVAREPLSDSHRNIDLEPH